MQEIVYEKRHRGNAKNIKVLVFVEVARPLTEGKILEDFEWRRTNTSPYPPKKVLEYVKAHLAASGLVPESIKYDHYAGCSMCPCSPGYVIKCQKFGGEFRTWNTPILALYVKMEELNP